MFDFSGLGYTIQRLQAPLCVLFYATALLIAVRMPNVREIVSRFRYTTMRAIGLAILFLLCFLSLSGVATYIYFNF
jgi:alginate O-acetyltransferase complex protein AlgI